MVHGILRGCPGEPRQDTAEILCVDVASIGSRELKQTRTATATWGTRKKTVYVFLTSLQLCLFLTWLKFLPFLPKFYCFIVSNYWRATVVICQNDVHVLTTTSKWSNWSRTWGKTTPRSCQFHIFTCSFCFLQLVLLFHWRCRCRLPYWCLSSLVSQCQRNNIEAEITFHFACKIRFSYAQFILERNKCLQ